jgi:hypothetical protein
MGLRSSLLAVAVGAFAVGVAAGAAPARAATVTDIVSFDILGSYGNPSPPGYNSSGEAVVSFDITFDPTKLYLPQLSAGIINNLSVAVTDSSYTPSSLTFNPVEYFAFTPGGSGGLGGTLSLSSLLSMSTSILDTDDITIIINAVPSASVWYSQLGVPGDYHTSTISGPYLSYFGQPVGSLSVTTPLPSTWTMMLIGVVGLGLFSCWGKKPRSSVCEVA